MESSKRDNIMTIPCVGKSDSKILRKLVSLLREQQSKIEEMYSFLDVDSIYEMKRVINSQQYKIDMLREKLKKQAQAKKQEQVRVQPNKEKLFVYWLITFLFFLIGLRIIYLLPTGNFQAELQTDLQKDLEIEFLQNELKETREFYSSVSKFVFVSLSIGLILGFSILSSLKKKIHYQEKLIADHIYQGLISSYQVQGQQEQVRINEGQQFKLFLFGITFFVFVFELYILSTFF